MNCIEPELLSAYLDREVGSEERRLVDGHLALCRRCRASLRLTEALGERMRLEPLAEMPAGLRARLEGMAAAAQGKHGEIPIAGARVYAPEPATHLWATGFSLIRHGWPILRPALGVSLAYAVWVLGLGWRPEAGGGPTLPAEFVLEAHVRYALTLPLSREEVVIADLPLAAPAADTFPEGVGDRSLPLADGL